MQRGVSQGVGGPGAHAGHREDDPDDGRDDVDVRDEGVGAVAGADEVLAEGVQGGEEVVGDGEEEGDLTCDVNRGEDRGVGGPAAGGEGGGVDRGGGGGVDLPESGDLVGGELEKGDGAGEGPPHLFFMSSISSMMLWVGCSSLLTIRLMLRARGSRLKNSLERSSCPSSSRSWPPRKGNVSMTFERRTKRCAMVLLRAASSQGPPPKPQTRLK